MSVGPLAAGLFDFEPFEPTPAAARARLERVRPEAYARTRNHLEGAVTQLSPYITHGLLPLHEVVGHLRARYRLDLGHKLVQELGWRAWWHHAWRHRGEAIFTSLHAGPLPEATYARELPDDVRAACTGVPVIDQAVRALYATGYVHNHARMWLASYLVHLRHVHWRCGADWMHGHLLDGDLASNHLSWQWVAGTGSHKPYLFNAENVARYAPLAWHSFGTEIDDSYEALERRARGGPRRRTPPQAGEESITEPTLTAHRPGGDSPQPHPADFQGRRVWLVHPWSLDGPPADLPAGTLVAGLWPADHHARWPWSPARWRFVGQRMEAVTALQRRGTAAQWRAALAGALSVDAWDDLHLGALGTALGLRPRPAAFAEPARACSSFSQYWQAVSRAESGPHTGRKLA